MNFQIYLIFTLLNSFGPASSAHGTWRVSFSSTGPAYAGWTAHAQPRGAGLVQGSRPGCSEHWTVDRVVQVLCFGSDIKVSGPLSCLPTPKQKHAFGVQGTTVWAEPGMLGDTPGSVLRAASISVPGTMCAEDETGQKPTKKVS